MKYPIAGYFTCFTVLLVTGTVGLMLSWLQEHLGVLALVIVLVLATGILTRRLANRAPRPPKPTGTRVGNLYYHNPANIPNAPSYVAVERRKRRDRK